jgi:hypothetical protein
MTTTRARVVEPLNRVLLAQIKMAEGFWTISLGIYLLSISLGLSSSTSDGKVIELREDNWNQILEGEWMIKL